MAVLFIEFESAISSERYEVNAKGAPNASRDQVALMLQSLLDDRFHLKIHRESRELPVYHLVIAKGGPKLPVAKENGCEEDEALPELTGGRMAPPGSIPAPRSRCGGLSVMLHYTGPRMFGGKIAMPELVRMLEVVLGRAVVDQTGLTGSFDVQLDFMADESTPVLPPPPPGMSTDRMNPPFTAISQQLGLRLEAAKGQVEVIVIDHTERPSAN